jgi:hypothetical protein
MSLYKKAMIRSIRSFFTGLRASRLYGRASVLREVGRFDEALKVGRQSLSVLRAPWVIRLRPNEGSVLLCATVLVEQLATKLEVPGADEIDIADALANLKTLPSDSAHEILGGRNWTKHFELRLSSKGNSNGA